MTGLYQHSLSLIKFHHCLINTSKEIIFPTIVVATVPKKCPCMFCVRKLYPIIVMFTYDLMIMSIFSFFLEIPFSQTLKSEPSSVSRELCSPHQHDQCVFTLCMGSCVCVCVNPWTGSKWEKSETATHQRSRLAFREQITLCLIMWPSLLLDFIHFSLWRR